jgi:N-methylhydantoinase A
MRVGVDIGGTFTDGVAVDRRGHMIGHLKVPSTPPRVEEGALAVARSLGADDLERIVHGTTVATNAIVQRRLGSTALITTEGFRDVLAIGTQRRPDLYDPFQEKPAPIVPRHLRLEAVERIAADGSVIVPLDVESVSRAARHLRAEGVAAVAITFLFSYVNPRHERVAGRIIRRECPGIEVALSSDVAPLIREYPRTSTTVVNAALRPILAPYLDRLQSDAGTDVLVMQSSGGVVPAAEAGRLGHQLLASGPAGGVVAASSFAGTGGIRDLVTMDMGGTSFDACLVQSGLPTVRGEQVVGGYPVLAPALDLVTVGAGGGSLARVDAGRALRVGPESAGADPGPACYGRGGVLPTVTDANVVLGRINPERFLEGRLALDVESAARTVHDHVAKPLDLSLDEAALAIVEVASATMGRALRVITVGRGRDPATLPLVAFGGAGPLHAVRLAEELGSPNVLVPPLA